MTAKPLLIVVSGPSGSGKGTILSLLRQKLDCYYSVSLTTRSPRAGETDGVEYFFVSDELFSDHLAHGDFLEWAQVYNHRYGTLRRPVEEALAAGRDVLMELDIQGARQVKRAFKEAVLIFIKPPSLQELDARITKRGKDSPETIRIRMESAPEELKAAADYDYVILNDEPERAANKLLSIIEEERNR